MHCAGTLHQFAACHMRAISVCKRSVLSGGHPIFCCCAPVAVWLPLAFGYSVPTTKLPSFVFRFLAHFDKLLKVVLADLDNHVSYITLLLLQ